MVMRERGIKGNPVLDKLMKLKYRINDYYKDHVKKGGPKTWMTADARLTKMDKEWTMAEITNLRQGGWLSATKMKVANEMWSKYGG